MIKHAFLINNSLLHEHPTPIIQHNNAIQIEFVEISFISFNKKILH